mmetsp:Transcript_8516/g.10772  ORF Transcript_8516/g.10772 Transcript_8516/m.10772 type:complete len:554 (-) Transcript_8516:97-1758(-)
MIFINKLYQWLLVLHVPLLSHHNKEAEAMKESSSLTTEKEIFKGHHRLNSFQSRTISKKIGSDIVGDEEWARFGTSISLSSDGKRLAIGTPMDDGTNQQYSSTGKVQVMDLKFGRWVQVGADFYGYTDTDQLGASVSLSADGHRLAIGAPTNSDVDLSTGNIRIYDLDEDSSTWVQLGSKIDGEGRLDRFGTSVALSSDGDIVAAGAPKNDVDPGNNIYDSGHVRVFKFNGDDWVQMGDDINGNFGVVCPEREIGGFAGTVIALSEDGLRLALNDDKVVRVFDYNGVSWVQVGEDIVQPYIDIGSLSISADGNRLVVGNPGYRLSGNAGSINIYDFVDGTWKLAKSFFGVGEADRLGSSVSISGDGSSIFAGATTSSPYVDTPIGNGYVQTYTFNNTDWSEKIKFIGDSQGDLFGSSVASNSDGETFAVGATLFYSVGLVRVFQMGTDSCNDSPFTFKTKKPSGESIWRSCKWVATKSTNWRCQNFEGVSTMCPSTCGLCSDCVDSTSRMKFYKTPDATKKITRDCDWTATKSGARCEIEGMEDSCRKTCTNC